MVRKTAKKKTPAKTPKSKSKNYLDDVRELVRLMVANDLSEVDIQDNSRKILLKRGGGDVAVSAASDTSISSAAEPAAGGGAPGAEAETDAADGLIEIKSPMVGTFYASQSPDSEPFVGVGDSINEETVVCIVEAMKVMNEIKADCAGSVVEVRVQNAQPVEFGQVLFRLKPVS